MEIRKHYIFHGRVQGVGFRFTLYQKANQLGLTGWVRNCYDGTVEACLQGEQESIIKAITLLDQNRFIQIESMDVKNLDVLKDEQSFEMKN